MTDSNTTAAPGAHQDIKAFSARFEREGWPRIGETFARSEQVFVVTGAARVGAVAVLTFWSKCKTCDAPFEAAVNWHPMGMPIGSCVEHRISPHNPYEPKPADPDAPKPARKKKKKAKKEGPRAPTFGRFEQIVLDVVDELSMVYADIELDMLLRRAKDRVEAPPAAERDTRRQQCLRAVYSAAKKKGWDVAGGVLYTGTGVC